MLHTSVYHLSFALPLLLGAWSVARAPAEPEAFTLTVVVRGATQEGGSLDAALFASAHDYLNAERVAQHLTRPRTAAVDSLVFHGVRPGRYAVAAFHDANDNGKLDKYIYGAPRESWGMSGNVRPRLRAPRFDEAVVEVAANTRVVIEVKR